MAEEKRGFLLYSDIKDMVNALPDDKAGKLFKIILAYVNDLNPQIDDLLLKVSFEPIKQQLKRDLEKWSTTKKGRSDAGKASAEARKQQKQHLLNVLNKKQQSSTNSTVSVNDNVNVNVNVKKKEGGKSKKIFMPPSEIEVIAYFAENGYTSEAATKAFKFYNTADWHDSKGNKVKNWKQKMQGVWFTDENLAKGESGPIKSKFSFI
jgi:hypothetical protein